MSTWVISPCKRSRVAELLAMLASLGHDSAHVVVVTTLPDPVEGDDVAGYADHVVVFEEPGMLFGRWLNLGFDYIDAIDSSQHEFLCIGSSLLGAPHTVPTLRAALRGRDLAMVGPDLFDRLGVGDVEEHRDDQRTLWNRVPGICFMVPGELGLRFDPEFRWWFGEDDLEMQARALGPVGLVGRCGVTLTAPNGHPLSDEQHQWAREDRAKFVAKWSKEPW